VADGVYSCYIHLLNKKHSGVYMNVMWVRAAAWPHFCGYWKQGGTRVSSTGDRPGGGRKFLWDVTRYGDGDELRQYCSDEMCGQSAREQWCSC
jgi:hypothetical protein